MEGNIYLDMDSWNKGSLSDTDRHWQLVSLWKQYWNKIGNMWNCNKMEGGGGAAEDTGTAECEENLNFI